MIPVPDFRTCVACSVEMPADHHHYAVANVRKTGERTYRRKCRKCQSRENCALDKQRRADPNTRDAWKGRRRKTQKRFADKNRDRVRAWEKASREKRMADPVKRAEINAKARERYAENARDIREGLRFTYRAKADADGRTMANRNRRAFEPYQPPTAGTDLVSAEPFVAYMRTTFPKADTLTMAHALGMDTSEAKRVFDKGQARMSLVLIDRLLTGGLGRPDVVSTLYPVET